MYCAVSNRLFAARSSLGERMKEKGRKGGKEGGRRREEEGGRREGGREGGGRVVVRLVFKNDRKLAEVWE